MVLCFGKNNRDKIVNGGDGFSIDGWRLIPVPSMKNITSTNKHLDGNNVKSIPDNIEDRWWNVIMKNLNVFLFG